MTRATFSTEFKGRHNSLNLIRLVLAATVIIGHSFVLGQLGPEPALGRVGVASIAVFFFFGISGYLITASQFRTSVPRFLWHRTLRILPGYWVTAGVVALVFAPIAWTVYHGTVAGYPVAESFRYWAANLTLKTSLVPSIPGTQLTMADDVQYWNGAAWSLFFEALCYLAVAALAAFRLLRALPIAVVFGGGTALLLWWEVSPSSADIVFSHHDLYRLITVGTVFAAGALLYFLRDRVPVRWWLAVIAAALIGAGPFVFERPEWLLPAPVTYLVMYAAIRLPFSNVARVNDLSYGTYIYGYPVAQLLTVLRVNESGFWVYTAATFAITFALAAGSWFLIEKPALRLKSLGEKTRTPEPVPPAAAPV